ncbi:MAG: glycosyltransferase family 4 protein, partial [bacterium]|nr:glycosyltransferase family 4 protein [bacterium]
KTAVIYSPVDYELYHQLSPERVKKIGFLGRLDYIKGFDILIPAMNHIWERYPDITLHIAGREVNYKWPEIRDRFHGPVYYHGYLNHDQVIDFLKDMDLGVLPSKGSEMTSRALLEWWSSAKPVIASRVGIFPELIEHKKNGYLISPENSDELTEAIIFFIKNPEFLKTTGMWGLNKVKIELSFKVFSDNLKKIL